VEGGWASSWGFKEYQAERAVLAELPAEQPSPPAPSDGWLPGAGSPARAPRALRRPSVSSVVPSASARTETERPRAAHGATRSERQARRRMNDSSIAARSDGMQVPGPTPTSHSHARLRRRVLEAWPATDHAPVPADLRIRHHEPPPDGPRPCAGHQPRPRAGGSPNPPSPASRRASLGLYRSPVGALGGSARRTPQE